MPDTPGFAHWPLHHRPRGGHFPRQGLCPARRPTVHPLRQRYGLGLSPVVDVDPSDCINHLAALPPAGSAPREPAQIAPGRSTSQRSCPAEVAQGLAVCVAASHHPATWIAPRVRTLREICIRIRRCGPVGPTPGLTPQPLTSFESRSVSPPPPALKLGTARWRGPQPIRLRGHPGPTRVAPLPSRFPATPRSHRQWAAPCRIPSPGRHSVGRVTTPFQATLSSTLNTAKSLILKRFPAM